MRLVHTSDWHLGRSLHGRRRIEEMEAFLTWLVGTIAREGASAVLVAGDIFDTGTPSNRAQEAYYRFLRDARAAGCRHVVITAGNHDSPSFLDAPRELLRGFDVHVRGAASADPADEVIVLRDPSGAPEAVVGAVPYLRDRDLRLAEAGETTLDKENKLREGIAARYGAVCDEARARREKEGGGDVPIILMGHLYTSGARLADGDGERDLYLGTALHVPAEIFPADADYVALGHLHVPQIVAGRQSVRYSGAPYAMGFTENRQARGVCLVDVSAGEAGVRFLETPVFQELERVTGDLDAIRLRIAALAEAGSRAWLEVVYDGQEVVGDLQAVVAGATAGTMLEVLRITDRSLAARLPSAATVGVTLDELDEHQVFDRVLEAARIPEEQRSGLCEAYREILVALNERDGRAR